MYVVQSVIFGTKRQSKSVLFLFSFDFSINSKHTVRAIRKISEMQIKIISHNKLVKIKIRLGNIIFHSFYLPTKVKNNGNYMIFHCDISSFTICRILSRLDNHLINELLIHTPRKNFCKDWCEKIVKSASYVIKTLQRSSCYIIPLFL